MASPYKIHLEMYDGPLDLLLDLIKKQEIDIHNIRSPRSRANISTTSTSSSSWTWMSRPISFTWRDAHLHQVQMLLPPDPLAGPEESEDPRADLVHRLVEHEKFKSAANCFTSASRSRKTSGRSRTAPCTKAKNPKAS